MGREAVFGWPGGGGGGSRDEFSRRRKSLPSLSPLSRNVPTRPGPARPATRASYSRPASPSHSRRVYRCFNSFSSWVRRASRGRAVRGGGGTWSDKYDGNYDSVDDDDDDDDYDDDDYDYDNVNQEQEQVPVTKFLPRISEALLARPYLFSSIRAVDCRGSDPRSQRLSGKLNQERENPLGLTGMVPRARA
jgi:hypothetical protein